MPQLFSYTFLTILLLSTAQIYGQSDAPEIQNPTLAQEIKAMRDTDQKLRIKWANMVKKGKDSGKKYEALTNQLIQTDINNTNRMKAIIEEHGWPTRTMVGNRSSNNAWLLVQHADRDPLFQIKCLPLLKEAVDNKEANPSNYAYLYDRVAVAQGKRQLYATQSSSNNGLKEGDFYPLEDESKVQERRAEMGIDIHVEAYARSMGFEYKVPTAKEAEQRAAAMVEQYNRDLNQATEALDMEDFDAAILHYRNATMAYGISTAQDFYNYAKLLSVTNHQDCGYAAYALLKALLKGISNPESWDDDPDFDNAKKKSPRNWKMLQTQIMEKAKN